jgi:hypothetical protein
VFSSRYSIHNLCWFSTVYVYAEGNFSEYPFESIFVPHSASQLHIHRQVTVHYPETSRVTFVSFNEPLNYDGCSIQSMIQDEGGFNFHYAEMQSRFTCTEAGSMWAIRGPYSAPASKGYKRWPKTYIKKVKRAWHVYFALLSQTTQLLLMFLFFSLFCYRFVLLIFAVGLRSFVSFVCL